jgi:hypothetical protein
MTNEIEQHDDAPTSNGGNGGRDPVTGRFVKGNRAAVGRRHPLAARVQELKGVVQDALTDGRVKAVMDAMIGRACGGDVAAARLLLEYGIGPASKLELNIGIGVGTKRIILEHLSPDDPRRNLRAFGAEPHRLPGPMHTDDASDATPAETDTCDNADDQGPDDCAPTGSDQAVIERHSPSCDPTKEHADAGPESPANASEPAPDPSPAEPPERDDSPAPDPYRPYHRPTNGDTP